jgi:hypothetical protein
MPREVDPKNTRKALRRVRRLAALKEGETAPDLSGWEDDFITEVEGRLEKYGSAFADLGKGRAEDALSVLQAQKLREIERKAKAKAKGDDGDRPRPRSSFKRKPPGWATARPDDEA